MTRQEAYELTLVALCIWREARTESDEGLIAVGCVIRERVQGGWPGSAWWGKTWVEVVTKKWQFSSITANDDPQLGLFPKENDPIFLRCLEIAEYVMSGDIRKRKRKVRVSLVVLEVPDASRCVQVAACSLQILPSKEVQ